MSQKNKKRGKAVSPLYESVMKLAKKLECKNCYGKGYSTQLVANAIHIKFCACKWGTHLARKTEGTMVIYTECYRLPKDFKKLSKVLKSSHGDNANLTKHNRRHKTKRASRAGKNHRQEGFIPGLVS